MAKTFRARRYRKRAPRRGRKTRRAGNPLTRLPGTLAPSRMLVTLKYLNTLGKSAPAGKVANFNQFRLNSIWDPDYTNTLGTSCLGVSQWTTPANYLDTTFSWSDIMRPGAKRFEIGNREGQNKTVVRGVVNLPKLTGINATQYKADPHNLAGMGQSPVQPLYITVILTNSNPTLAANVVCQVEMTYYTELMGIVPTVEAIDLNTGLPVVPQANVCTGGLIAPPGGLTPS